MAKFLYKALIKLAQMRLIVVVVNVNMRDHSILVQIPGDNNRFKIPEREERHSVDSF